MNLKNEKVGKDMCLVLPNYAPPRPAKKAAHAFKERKSESLVIRIKHGELE